MEFYAIKNNGLIVDIQLGSKYVSENDLKSLVWNCLISLHFENFKDVINWKYFDPFDANDPGLYILKISENLWCFWYFQGVWNGNIGLKYVFYY